MPDDTKQVVRFVVWHPDANKGDIGHTQDEAWEVAVRNIFGITSANEHYAARIQDMKNHGYFVSELHTHDR